MSFPDTKPTLVQRLATGGGEADWREFMTDYWGPVCRFATRRARLTLSDAEDVAAQVFAIIFKRNLLSGWVQGPSAKLRTLLCSIVRKILANRQRIADGRQRILTSLEAEDFSVSVLGTERVSSESVDLFYAAWVDDLLERVVQSLFDEYYSADRGHCFLVLYGRICDEMTHAEIAESLCLSISKVEYSYKTARSRLAEKLKNDVREQVARHCPQQEVEKEFHDEWNSLGLYLKSNGGLEAVLRRACYGRAMMIDRQRTERLISATLNQTLGARGPI
jgi:DNA-directed RNA polymerase specialized sigma24 family protein